MQKSWKIILIGLSIITALVFLRLYRHITYNRWRFHHVTNEQIYLLDVHNMPTHAPNHIQARLAWSLWHNDIEAIKNALAARPYANYLASALQGLPPIPEKKLLSPYAIVIEGYLARTYLEENFEHIRTALDKFYECVQYLVKNDISVDIGVLTLDPHPSMREFVKDSFARLNQEKISQGMLDDEGEYALSVLQKIKSAIDTYQPNSD